MHFVAFGFGFSSILVNIFQCTPVAKAYTSAMGGYCVNMGDFLYANSSLMMATDLVLYIMPVVFTWNLQLRRAQRFGVNFLFGLGSLYDFPTAAAACCRWTKCTDAVIRVIVASALRVRACHYFATLPDFPCKQQFRRLNSNISDTHAQGGLDK